MKKILFLIIPLIVFQMFLINVKAGNPDWDINEGGAENNTGGQCDSSTGALCRNNGTGTTYLYASLTNDARSDNYVKRWEFTGEISERVAAANAKHDEITANRDSVCAFLSEIGIDCNDPTVCDRTEYVYFAISAAYYRYKQYVPQHTVKELARICAAGADCSNMSIGAISRYFYVTNANTGVYSVAATKTSDVSLIADITSGYGVAAIRLSDYNICTPTPTPTPNICNGVGIAQSGTLNQCVDRNSIVSSTFKDVIDYSQSGTGSENGVKEYDIGGSDGYCSLYCLETNASAYLPGGLANAIGLGSSIVWPTSENTFTSKFGNNFPLVFNGTRKCTIQVAPNLTYGRMCKVDPVKDYKDARTELTTAKNNNYNIKGIADSANNYVSGPIQRVNNTNKLTWDNETIRKLSSECTSPPGDDKPNSSIPANTCADSTYWNYYRNIANSNASNASSKYSQVYNNYKSIHPTYHATPYETCPAGDSHTCDSSGNVGLGTSCCNPDTAYKCDYGGGLAGTTTCNMTESYAIAHDRTVSFWYNAKNAWNNFKSAVSSKYNKFTTYVTKYREAVNIYLKVKLCSDYSKDEMTCSGSSCKYYNFTTNASLKYEYEDNRNVYIPLEIEKDVNYSCDMCGNELAPMRKKVSLYSSYDYLMNQADVGHLQQMISKIQNTPITMNSGNVEYAISEYVENKYIDKETLEVKESMPHHQNYILLSFRNLPTSFNNKPGKKYDLILYGISLGHNGKMNSSNRFLSWPSSGEYICHYEVTTTPTECLCPPGTKNYGADLYQAVLNDRLTCADAKVRYCDADNVPECRENCVNNKYCPNDHTIEITGCVNSGESYSSCVSKLCNGTGKFVCPPGTLLHDMDITNCVQSKISKGYSERNAKNYCEKKVCNFNNIVIYRTIDLKNPFPSIDADATISQTGLYYGMFNLNVRGRYPGYNWNGAQLVRKEILQNRNVSSYEIYNKKPLYHFELDTSTILEIREYNKRQATHDDGYNDFTLQCVSTETNKYVGTACLSRFVHDIRYGGDTTGSKSLCGGAGTTTTLANCLYTASNS